MYKKNEAKLLGGLNMSEWVYNSSWELWGACIVELAMKGMKGSWNELKTVWNIWIMINGSRYFIDLSFNWHSINDFGFVLSAWYSTEDFPILRNKPLLMLGECVCCYLYYCGAVVNSGNAKSHSSTPSSITFM